MANQLSDSKVWKAMTAIASSLITNLLYSFITNESYIVQQEGEQYIITAGANSIKSNAFAFVSILLIFFILWGVLMAAIPMYSKIYRQLKYRKVNFHSRKDLINEMDTVKDQTIKLKDIFYDEQDIIFNKDLAILQIRTLASAISSLHGKFIPHNKQQKKHMNDNFRNPDYSSIFNINYSISQYEFLALIRVLQKMTSNILLYIGEDELMEKDCNEMLRMLKELEELPK